MRKRELLATFRSPSSWQFHLTAWGQSTRMLRDDRAERVEMLRHWADFTWRSLSSAIHCHFWFRLVILHFSIKTPLFSERHCCFWTWIIRNPSGKGKFQKNMIDYTFTWQKASSQWFKIHQQINLSSHFLCVELFMKLPISWPYFKKLLWTQHPRDVCAGNVNNENAKPQAIVARLSWPSLYIKIRKKINWI